MHISIAIRINIEMLSPIFQEHIQTKLASGTTGEAYFNNLYDLYTKTQTLGTQLSQFNLDQSLLPQLTKAIFQTHLQAYSRSVLTANC